MKSKWTARSLSRVLSHFKSKAPAAMTHQAMFSPPQLFGAIEGKERNVAMDSALTNYTTTLDNAGMGLVSLPPFIGYANLAVLETHPLIRDIVETTGDEMVKKWIKFSIEQAGDSPAPDPKETVIAMAAGKNPEALQQETDDEKAKQDEVKLQKLGTMFDRLRVKDRLRDAAKRSHYMGGCALFIDMGDDSETTEGRAEIETPLIIDKRKIRKGKFKGLRLIEPVTMYPGPYNSTNSLKDDFYVPEKWYIMGGIAVHKSRLLFFVPNPLSFMFRPAYNFFGISTTQLVLDYVETFDSVRKDGANIIRKFSLTSLATDMSQALQENATPADIQGLTSRAQIFTEARDNLGLFLTDKENEELSQLNTPVTGLENIAGKHLEFLAAAARIPAVKLLGISPSGFNATGESDLKNWYDYIASNQEKLFREPVETILRIVQISEWGDVDDSIAVDFLPLYEATPAEVAAEQKTKVETGKALIDAGVITPEEERRRIAADPDSGYNSLDPGNVPEPPEPDLPPEFMQGKDVPPQEEGDDEKSPDGAE